MRVIKKIKEGNIPYKGYSIINSKEKGLYLVKDPEGKWVGNGFATDTEAMEVIDNLVDKIEESSGRSSADLIALVREQLSLETIFTELINMIPHDQLVEYFEDIINLYSLRNFEDEEY